VPRAPRASLRLLPWLAAALALALALATLWRTRPPSPPPAPRAPAAAAGDAAATPPAGAWPELPFAPPPLPEDLRRVPLPSAGWTLDAHHVVEDVRRTLRGARGGAYAEARAEAVRADLALFPPPDDEIRRLLLSGPTERAWAFVALAARPPDDDDLVALAFRTMEPADDPAVRLLAADLCAALPPERISRMEEEVLRAFREEPDPLVLATALPGLERLEAARLAALFQAQLARAGPDMRRVLVLLAASRLGPEALGAVDPTTDATPP
jgi:hypothetical protein